MERREGKTRVTPSTYITEVKSFVTLMQVSSQNMSFVTRFAVKLDEVFFLVKTFQVEFSTLRQAVLL